MAECLIESWKCNYTNWLKERQQHNRSKGFMPTTFVTDTANWAA